MKDLPLRFLTAIILGIVVIGSIYYSFLSFSLLLLLIAVISGYEYIRLAAFGAEISNPEEIKRMGAAITGLPLAVSMLAGPAWVWAEPDQGCDEGGRLGRATASRR